MINASFVFGLDDDDPSIFQRTVDWAVRNGIQTATFHILTPYPGTRLFERMKAAGKINHFIWDIYDTRHAVFTPAKMSSQQLENGYWQSYTDFYRYSNIFKSANVQIGLLNKLRHLAYVSGWKKFEPLWDWVIRKGFLPYLLPLLETTLQGKPPESKDSPTKYTKNAHEYPF